MNSRYLHHLRVSLITLDLFLIDAVFIPGWYFFQLHSLILHSVAYIYLCIFLNASWLVSAWFGNIYHSKNIVSFEQFTRCSMYAFLYFVGFVSIYLYIFRQIEISRFFYLMFIIGLAGGLLFNRFMHLAFLQYIKHKDKVTNKVIIIGYNNLSKKIAGYLSADGADGVPKEILGYCEEYSNIKELSHYPILGDIKSTVDTCKRLGATEIYSTIAPEQQPLIYELMQNADRNCIRFKIIPDISLYVKKQVHIDFLNEIPVISMRADPLEDLGNRIKKRAADLLVSSFFILFFLSWMIPIIGLLIWLENRGPIFFKQARSGKGNESFNCLKFRSMRNNSAANERQATRYDDRITRVGKFLRRTSLDEFPQFLNVFMGNMSVVGPRPHMLKHTAEYSRLIGHYMVRQFLKPGITGWAQVNGYRGETHAIEQMQKRVEYDLWYLENWTPWLDLKIVFLTAFNILRGEKNAH